MKVFFYHILPIEKVYELYKVGKYPGHLLYGMTNFKEEGIDIAYYNKNFNYSMRRTKLMLYNLWNLFIKKTDMDLLYSVTWRGIELIILLRALGIYRKPIVLWHHSSVVVPKSFMRRWISKFIYKGVDEYIFFSNELLNRSLKTKKISEHNSTVVHWGADIQFYDRISSETEELPTKCFISTGIENRDFITLIEAMKGVDSKCEIYTKSQFGNSLKYTDLLSQYKSFPHNISFKIVNDTLENLAIKVAQSYCVVICCLDISYTVGLTTLIEAMALGKPVIATDNPTFPFDIEKENIGIKVGFGDVKGWNKAIRFIEDNPEIARQMGRNGRALIEKLYNLNNLSNEVSSILLKYRKT